MHFLNGIGIKQAKRAPLVGVDTVFVGLVTGMENDVRGEGGRERRRQITAIGQPQWVEVCKEMGWDPFENTWMLRRAGLSIGGMSFVPEHVGQFMRIGEDVVLEITGETKPCERMDEIAPGLKDALAVSMRGGVTCRVIQSGRINLWDHVVIHTQDPL